MLPRACRAADTTGALTYTSVSDTVAHLFSGTAGALSTLVKAGVAVTVTDVATIAQLTAIDGKTTGTVTYTSISDTVAHLFSGTNGALSTLVKAGIAVTVTSAARKT